MLKIMVYKKYFEEFCFDDGAYRSMCGKKPLNKKLLLLKYIWSLVKHKIAVIICNHKGHDWVNTGYGNTETGEDSGYCKRCGFSFRHILY